MLLNAGPNSDVVPKRVFPTAITSCFLNGVGSTDSTVSSNELVKDLVKQRAVVYGFDDGQRKVSQLIGRIGQPTHMRDEISF